MIFEIYFIQAEIERHQTLTEHKLLLMGNSYIINTEGFDKV